MKCIECENLDLKKSETMSKHGFGFCKKTSASYYSLAKDHDCKTFVRADNAKIQKRIDWYDKR